MQPNQRKCVLCKGDGQVYRFVGKLGIGSECPACKGFKYISIYYKRCLKCGGDGKDYPLFGKKGEPYNCLLCEGKGYLIDKKTVIAINYIKINI